jgi:hypothetical protein
MRRKGVKMTREERLQKMMVGRYLPEHAKVAAGVFEKLKRVAAEKNVVIVDDENFPWHIIAAGSHAGHLVSLFCKGFRRTIEVQPLTLKGLADHRYKEMSYETPEGAINYILKLQTWRNP